ncbi:MAG: amino acid ABC transporter permease [Chloroflexota bacterium]
MSEQVQFLLDNLPNLLFGFPGNRPGGLLITIFLTVVANSLGFVIALGLGFVSESNKRPLRWLARLYIEIFRGIPVLLLVLLTFQLIGNGRRWGLSLTPLFSAFVALTLYSSAYQAEIIKSGLRSVPVPLVESARLLGYPPLLTFRRLKIPYTVRLMLPALTGQTISLFKDTSVVLIIGVADLMTTARIILGSDVGNAPYWVGLYLMVGACYFAVAFTLSRIAYWIEAQTQSGDLIHAVGNY